MNKIEHIALEMQTQNNRSTSYPIFVVVEDKKIYGVENDELRERKDTDQIDAVEDLCDRCLKLWEKSELPDDCDHHECDPSFINYRIEEDVPNLRAAFFFTAKACDEHIAANRHHYNRTAKSYAISAYHNRELQYVMEYINPPKTPF